MNILVVGIEIILGIILLPFFIYIISKVQMLGWLAAIKQSNEEHERKSNHGKETENK